MPTDTDAIAKEALDLAVQHGAREDAIEELRTREALLSILRDANIEEDICEDVADACDISDLTALTIASGLLTVQEIADNCFLTVDEADVVFTNCAHTAFKLGVSFGRETVVSPRRLATFRRSPKAADVTAKPKIEEESSAIDSDSLKFDSPVKKNAPKRALFTAPADAPTEPQHEAAEPQPPASTAIKPVKSLPESTAASRAHDLRIKGKSASAPGHAPSLSKDSVKEGPSRSASGIRAPRRNVMQPTSRSNSASRVSSTAGERVAEKPRKSMMRPRSPVPKGTGATSTNAKKGQQAHAVPGAMQTKDAIKAGPAKPHINGTALPNRAGSLHEASSLDESQAVSKNGAMSSGYISLSNKSAKDSDLESSQVDTPMTSASGATQSDRKELAVESRMSENHVTSQSLTLDEGPASIPPSLLVAPREDLHPGEKAVAAPVTLAGHESIPNSPQTPREASGREMLKVESCQLNSGSTAPRITDQSGSSAVPGSIPAPLRYVSPPTPNSSGNGSVNSLSNVPAQDPSATKASETTEAATHTPEEAAASPVPLSDGCAPVQPNCISSTLPTSFAPKSPSSAQRPSRRPFPRVTHLKSPNKSPKAPIAAIRSPSAPHFAGRPNSPEATPRPTTPPARSRARQNSAYLQEGLEELGSTFLKYPGVLPSFMRPTAAHERRQAVEDEKRRSPSPSPRRAPRSVAPTAHFIRPTKSSSAKTGPSAPAITRAQSAVPVRNRSAMPRRPASATPAPRGEVRASAPTVFAPFCLHTEMRLPQRNRKTTDEIRLLEIKKQKAKEAAERHKQLERLAKAARMAKEARARTLSPKSASAAHKSRIKPFKLPSVATQEQVRKIPEVEKKAEVKHQPFKARPMPNMLSVFKPETSRAKPSTIPKPFNLTIRRNGTTVLADGKQQSPKGPLLSPQGVMSEFARSLRGEKA